MAQGTRAACLNRHFEQQLGVTFESVTVIGAKMNVAVTCPICGLVFDATGGGDGTFSTVEGRFQRVREAAAALSGLAVHDLRDLAGQLQAVQRGDVTADEAAEAADDERIRRFWDVLPRTRTELYAALALLVTLISLILATLPKDDDNVSPEVVREIVDQLERHGDGAPAPTPEPPSPTDPSTGPGPATSSSSEP